MLHIRPGRPEIGGPLVVKWRPPRTTAILKAQARNHRIQGSYSLVESIYMGQRTEVGVMLRFYSAVR
jgi:hypothetical protein